MTQRASLLIIAMAFAGCTQTTGPAGADGITVKGSVSDVLTRAPIVDTEVCLIVPENGGCVNTGLNGQFEFPGVPKNSRVLFRFIKNGYYPNQAHYTTQEEEEFLTYLLTNDEVNDLAFNVTGVVRDDNKSTVIFAVRTAKGPEATNVADVKITLDPASGEGPFFASGTTLDRNRETTTTTGGGTIFNVEPGTYKLRFEHPSKTCRPYYGWAAPDEEHTLEVRAEGGFITYSNMICVD